MKKYMKGEFSTKKLNALEKNLNKIYARNKVSKPITFIYVLFSFFLFSFLNTMTLRYMFDFIDLIDYSNVFGLSFLQQLIDSVHLKLSSNMQLLVPIVLPFIIALICGIFMVILIILMHTIKNILITGKNAETVTAVDDIDKIKQLIEKSREFKNYYFDPMHWAMLGTHLFSVGFMTVLLITDDPDMFFEPFWIVSIICLVATTIISTIPFFLYLSATHYVNSSLYDYSEKINSMKKILDKWWVETDPVEKTRREKAAEKARRESLAEYEAKKSAERAFLNKVTKTTAKSFEHGPLATADNCGMPPIDVSGM